MKQRNHAVDLDGKRVKLQSKSNGLHENVSGLGYQTLVLTENVLLCVRVRPSEILETCELPVAHHVHSVLFFKQHLSSSIACMHRKRFIKFHVSINQNFLVLVGMCPIVY